MISPPPSLLTRLDPAEVQRTETFNKLDSIDLKENKRVTAFLSGVSVLKKIQEDNIT